MNTEVLGVILQIVVMVGLTRSLDKYIARVYEGERTYLDFIKPAERLMYKLSGVSPDEGMDWKKFLRALFVMSLFWFVWDVVLLVAQGILPLNPDGNIGQTCHQAFNTHIPFMVNCSLQHYSGESDLTYFTQLSVIMLFQFVTAAAGMAAMADIIKGLAAEATQITGNFWHYLVLSTTHTLLPLSLVVGMILVVEGTPMGFNRKVELTTLGGQKQEASQGPTTVIVSIKQLGMDGGGYLDVNSSHPLEDPTYLVNMVEYCSTLITPMASAFAFGFYLKCRRLGYSIFEVMLFAYPVDMGINMYQEMNGNPWIYAMGTAQNGGVMKGKEVHIGSAAGALWSITTTVTSNGLVNLMHDSTMPLSGMIEMLNMQINTWFGGVGIGWVNYFTFLVVAVFISGLMVGRTPEFLGRKVEAREMKVASMVALLHPFVILASIALATYLFVHAPKFVASEGGWLNNPGYHGLSEMLCGYTPSVVNNGSGFEGLGDDTWFWNYPCGIMLILERFVPIVNQVAIAGILTKKKYIPESARTLKTDIVTFDVMAFAVIFVVAALSFFPVHTLSTIAEHLIL